jgi:hypothetical protein
VRTAVGNEARLVQDGILKGPQPGNGRNWFWWAKLNIFRPLWDDHDKVLYLDLDTVVQGNLDTLLEKEGFRMLHWERKFYPYGSGVMLFRSGEWGALSQFDVRRREVYRKKGDQQYIHESVSDATMGLMPFPITPDEACSYKNHWRKDLHRDAPIVCFHGKPRPHQLEDDNPLKTRWEASSGKIVEKTS